MRFLEFFAGGGMARAGLGAAWTCAFANDIDKRKAAAYRENWGDEHLSVCDIATLRGTQLPNADLAWASFPCQDLSLAGGGAGLGGERSGVYWEFCRILGELKQEGRLPPVVALENVYGAVTSNDGADLRALLASLAELGYRAGALLLDAADFVPQSRMRLFVVGFQGEPPPELVGGVAHPALERALGVDALWWTLPPPPERTLTLADIIEEEPMGVTWHTEEETGHLLEMMSDAHRAALETAMARGQVIGTVYRRTRKGQQRAELRLDGLAGCLRTPSGGSSRQTVVIAGKGRVRSRLLSPREAARLMGLPEDYRLPARYNDAYRLSGDGLAVPVVEWLSRHLLEPLCGYASEHGNPGTAAVRGATRLSGQGAAVRGTGGNRAGTAARVTARP